jgi:hypothetical protein
VSTICRDELVGILGCQVECPKCVGKLLSGKLKAAGDEQGAFQIVVVEKAADAVHQLLRQAVHGPEFLRSRALGISLLMIEL